MGGKVVAVVFWPASAGILEPQEDAGLLPLQVGKDVKGGAVAVLFLLLVHEHAGHGIEGGCIPEGVVVGIDAQLHLEHLGIYNVELQVPAKVHGQHGERQYILVGRGLEQGRIVQMHDAQGKVLGNAGGEHAHGRGVLPHDAQGIVVDIVGKKGIAGVGTEFPLGYTEAGLQFGGGYLAEVVLPLVVVGVEMLVIEFRLLERGLKMGPQRHGALGLTPERVQV